MHPLEAMKLAGPAGLEALQARDAFHARHLGAEGDDARAMLAAIGADSIDALVAQTVPAPIRLEAPLALPDPVPEHAALAELRALAARNQVWRSFLGTGYHGTFTPEPIRRNVLENPGWYTAYTPYQAEISQGRLEALLNFQQMVVDLTGLPVANASLLDEATAAAEAMTLIRRSVRKPGGRFLIDAGCHPQVIAVMLTRARWAGIDAVVADPEVLLASGGSQEPDRPAGPDEPGAPGGAGNPSDPKRSDSPGDRLTAGDLFGAHLQNPDTWGRVRDLTGLIDALHAAGAMVSVGCDPLSLLLVKSPGGMGADVAIGSAQRFGVPMGAGGPHAAFMAVRAELVRSMPGRIIGVSRDAAGRPALRMALQTREQHIRRDKATSNICTAQALLAVMAGLYAVWHGAEGLARIALRANFMARLLAEAVAAAGLRPLHDAFFDTVTFDAGDRSDAIRARAESLRMNLRVETAGAGPDGAPRARVSIAFDETTTLADVADVAFALTGTRVEVAALAAAQGIDCASIPPSARRADAVLTHPVFTSHRTETEFMRYLKRLENKDYSLVHGMIPLGSCTMKLNAAAEMAPVSWPQFADLHPFAPADQLAGYAAMIGQLGDWLAEITGFASVSFQPNSGAQGEYAGLLAIRNYQIAQGQGHRDVCLIPHSAHGTNPASAQMMGLKIVVVACDAMGNVDLSDLRAKVEAHRDRVCALMATYPSTHGVFEHDIGEVCALVHDAGGQVYMDGANLNAQAGLTSPGRIGADVCHLNLHKTFCIPHGGGGPGMGPIAVAAHLAPYLASDPQAGANAAGVIAAEAGGAVFYDAGRAGVEAGRGAGAVSAAPWGSALILTISWMYIRMMGASGIRRATEVAILNANYVAARLKPYFPVLYAGDTGRVAHECILDMRPLKARFGVTAEDVAKRLMDYGFHAPTLSFPVADTLMVEPTESESRAELDRFCDAMIAIHAELEAIGAGTWDRSDNPLKNAPHTAEEIAAADWPHRYTREQAVYPLPAVRAAKFWPAVKRVDNAAGDRQLVCTCPPMEAYVEAVAQTE